MIARLISDLWSGYGHLMEITITQFKAKCLGIVEAVQSQKQVVTISRHGKAAARLVPVEPEDAPAWFGRAAATTRIHDDLTSSGEHWDADD